jgi:hypothetical protein
MTVFLKEPIAKKRLQQQEEATKVVKKARVRFFYIHIFSKNDITGQWIILDIF